MISRVGNCIVLSTFDSRDFGTTVGIAIFTAPSVVSVDNVSANINRGSTSVGGGSSGMSSLDPGGGGGGGIGTPVPLPVPGNGLIVAPSPVPSLVQK